MRAEIEAERAETQRRLDEAEANVQLARTEVDKIQIEIDNHTRWYNSLPDWDWPWLPSKAFGAIPYAVKQGALYFAKGLADVTLQIVYGLIEAIEAIANFIPIELDPRMSTRIASKFVVVTALDLARQTLWTLEALSQQFPIDADVRVIALLASHGVATAALNLAIEAIRLIDVTIASFAVDADPRIVALFVAYGVATAALTLAHAVLEGTRQFVAAIPVDLDPRVSALIVAKGVADLALDGVNLLLLGLEQSLGHLAEVLKFLIKGVGELFDVSSARFGLSLGEHAGNRLMLAIDVGVMGVYRHLAFDFDFGNPLASAADLGRAGRHAAAGCPLTCIQGTSASSAADMYDISWRRASMKAAAPACTQHSTGRQTTTHESLLKEKRLQLRPERSKSCQATHTLQQHTL